MNYRNNIFLIARLVLISLLILLIWTIIPPYFLKNDDVIHSMLVGGYGSIDFPSYSLFHLNSIIGFLAKNLPVILSIQPYNFVFTLLLIISFWMLYETLNLLLDDISLKIVLVSIIGSLYLFRPTFTILAGVYAAVGILLLFKFMEKQKSFYLYLSFVPFLLSFLLRYEQLFFTLIIFIPFLRSFIKSLNKGQFRSIIFFVLILFLLRTINTVLLESSIYDAIRSYFKVMVPLNDYTASDYLLTQENLLTKFNYSINDIKLLRNWFFFDLHISNFIELEQLLSESQWRAALFHSDHYKIFNSNLMLFQNKQIFILSALYMMLLALKVFNRFTLKSLLGLSLALLIGTLFGRQLPYIYLPLFILLILILLIRTDWKFTSFKLISTLIIGLLTLFSLQEYVYNKRIIAQAQKDFVGISEKKIYSIGSGLPMIEIYPLLDSVSWKKSLNIVSSDWSSFAPSSNFIKSMQSDHNFVSEIRTPNGVIVSLNEFHIPLLENYCLYKLGSRLNSMSIYNTKSINLYKMNCLSSDINLISKDLEFYDSGKSFTWVSAETNSFTISNYSSLNVEREIELIFKNNPCNFTIEGSLITPGEIVPFNSKTKIIKIPVKILAYEEEVFSFIPSVSSLPCLPGNGDNRKLYFSVSLK